MNNTDNFLGRTAGHEKIKCRLLRLIETDKLPHALLFYGPQGTGKEAVGLELGKFLLCQGENPICGSCKSCRILSNFEHPDFHYIFPIKSPKQKKAGFDWEAKMSENELVSFRTELTKKKEDLYYNINFPSATGILTDQIRRMIQRSSLTSYLSSNRFALISPADAMNITAQNALLKLLEEPPDGFFLCLITARPESILPTIASRCQSFYFPPLTEDEIRSGLKKIYKTQEKEIEKVVSRAGGSIVNALQLLKEGDPARTEALDDFLMAVIKENPIKIYKFCKKYEKSKDKVFLKEILLRLEQWFRDIALTDAKITPRFNKDIADRIDLFRKNVEYSDLAEMRSITLKAVDLIDKNVYIDLILSNLAIAYAKCFKLRR